TMGVEMVVVSEPDAWGIDSAIREELGRPPRTPTDGQGGTASSNEPQLPSAPPSSSQSAGTQVTERDYIRSLLNVVNSRTPADDVVSRLVTAGYSRGRIISVLEEMEKAGEIQIVRGPVGNITWIIRRR